MEAAYAKERERALRLKAALAQLQLTEAIVGGEKQPLDVLPLPKKGDRPTAQEVYVNQIGGDRLFTGLSKRTPSGGFFAA